MKRWLLLWFILSTCLLFAETFHTITTHDLSLEFTEDETFATSTENYSAYVTWDEENLYFCYKGPKLIFDPADTLRINDQSIFWYIDTDPQQDPKAGLGTDYAVEFNTQISPQPNLPYQPGDAPLPIWDKQTWDLPFNADYFVNVENPAINFGDVTFVGYDSESGSWTESHDLDSTRFKADTSQGFIKIQIPLDSLNNPTEINILAYIVSSEWVGEWYDLTYDPFGFVWDAKRDVVGGYASWPANSLEGGDGDYDEDGRFNTFYNWLLIDNVSPNIENLNPVADDDYETIEEDNPVTIDVLLNDNDPDSDPLSVGSIRNPAHGTVVNNGSSITYTPDPHYFGDDTLVYTVSDAKGGFGVGTVHLTINAVNDPPVVADDSVSTPLNNEITVAVLENDYEVEGEQMTITAVTEPGFGSASFTAGNVTYNPDSDYHGWDSFDYTVEDINGAPSVATVIVAVNDRPVAADDDAETGEDVPVEIDVLTNDDDPNTDALVIEAIIDPAHGTVVNNGSNVSYTPELNYNGSDLFQYIVADEYGDTDTASVSITIISINDAPLAVLDALTVEEDSTVTIDAMINDSDPDGDVISINSVSQGLHGSVTNNGDTTLTYQPELNYAGADSFTYVIKDPSGLLDTAWVKITLTAVNDAPEIVSLPDEMFLETGACAQLDMSLYQSDVDSPDSTLSWSFAVSDEAIGYSYNSENDTLDICSNGPIGDFSLFLTLKDDHNAEARDTIVVHVDSPSGLLNAASNIPNVFSLAQNYPNPFNPKTHIRYGLPKSSPVKLEIFSVTGQKLLTLFEGSKEAGYHTADFNAARFSSGVYFYRIHAGNFTSVKKMMLMK